MRVPAHPPRTMFASASFVNTGLSSPHLLSPNIDFTSIAQSIYSSERAFLAPRAGYTPIVWSQYFLAILRASSGTPPLVPPVNMATL